MLTIHHLGKSQSERILWLCEELGIPYELKRYTRDPVTMLSPPELKALHPLGAAPVITDGDDLLLAESGAIVDYILAKHGKGRLVVGPDHPDFAQYLYWLHFANGNFQPNMGRNMLMSRLDLPADNATLVGTRGRLARALDMLETRLGEVPYLAVPNSPWRTSCWCSRSPPCATSIRSIWRHTRTSSLTCAASASARRISGRCRRAIRGCRSC